MKTEPHWIYPDWPAPAQVQAVVSTRWGGVSSGSYASLNLAMHVGDDPLCVEENRRLLRQHLNLPTEPAWLDQVHGVDTVNAAGEGLRRADASYANRAGVVCSVLTADCLPVLFCDAAGTRVAAAHAGWKGLLDGILQHAVLAMGYGEADEVMAWLGPAIGPSAFVVDKDVREVFLGRFSGAEAAFVASPEQDGKWLADLYTLARLSLAEVYVDRVYGGGLCTFSDSERFYSYRRERVTGRMASLIWLSAAGASKRGDA